MAVWFVLTVAALAATLCVTIALTRRHGDGVDATVRSFDEFRHALEPELDGLATERHSLARRLDLVDDPTAGVPAPPETPSAP